MKLSEFIIETKESIENDSFIRITLSSPKKASIKLKKVKVRCIIIKEELYLSVSYQYFKKEITKNYLLPEGLEEIEYLLSKKFNNALLFTTDFDLQYQQHKHKETIHKKKPSIKLKPKRNHDISKEKIVNSNKDYFIKLGLSNSLGKPKTNSLDKFKQLEDLSKTYINEFKNSTLTRKKSLNIYELGCGKAGLSFLIEDLTKEIFNIKSNITGVDINRDVIDVNNKTKYALQKDNFKFILNDINNVKLKNPDILFALHACNTATDLSIAKGIEAGSKLMFFVPCCHQEVRPLISEPKYLLSYGIITEDIAENVTDLIRANVLRYFGYKVKVIEFVKTSVTPKNKLIIATKIADDYQKEALTQIKEIKNLFNITVPLTIETLLKIE
jgi:SAM-dependent methyltransferase